LKEREKRKSEWGEALGPVTVRLPVEGLKARIPAPGEAQKQVLREARCPFNVAFQKEGFVPLLRNTLPLSMWEI
jgi:hypothetical protein